MNKIAFIFHGTNGNPEENWFPWLKTKLEEMEYVVLVPDFPTPEGQSVAAWDAVLQEYQEYINEDAIFIGHSLGGIYLLRLLERRHTPIRAAFFTGTPIGLGKIPNYQTDYDFSGKHGFAFDWEAIRSGVAHVAVFHSDNDPYVPLENGEALATHLGVELSFIPNAGHFNLKAGYDTFPELLEAITNLDN